MHFRNFITVLLSLIFASNIVVQGDKFRPSTRIGTGRIIGQIARVEDSEVYEYLGVSFAQPPTGNLRFKKSKLITSYNGTLFANKQPPACPQYHESSVLVKEFPIGPERNEDCLYLNIWCPPDASANNTKAVFYWIFGGSYRFGSIRQEVFTGAPLAALGDVIVVTVNYRVGPFGFFYSASKHAPGNAGLHDILQGLQWVNRNIGFFGGDPSRVTIAGESVGSTSVGLLALTPLARGLFQRHIMESGSPVTQINYKERDLKDGQMLAEIVGCANASYTLEGNPKEVVRCLRGVSSEKISMADSKIPGVYGHDFVPVSGKDPILGHDPNRTISRGNFPCADLLIGNNRDEGTVFTIGMDNDLFGIYGEKNPDIGRDEAEAVIRKAYAPFPPDAETAIRYYLPPGLKDKNYTFRNQTYMAVGDVSFACPTLYYAQQCAKSGQGNVYYYEWLHRPSKSVFANWTGVYHTSEIRFVFGWPVLHPHEYLPQEVELSKQMIRAWTDFVKFGSPGEGWPLLSKETPQVRYLGVDIEQKVGVPSHLDRCRFLGPLMGYP